jgi:hypothetical protein
MRSTPIPLTLVLLAGCVNPAERFERFERRAEERRSDAGNADAPGACEPPAPNSVAGPALFALETSIGPGKPVLFFGEISTPEHEGRTHVYYAYRALNARDRATLVGDELSVGPFPLGAEGKFSVNIPEDTLPGEANAILPGVPITSSLMLSGRICGEQPFYCGDVSGRATSPLLADLSGSFAIELVRGLDAIPERPRYGCADDDLAPEL